jgi:hypothetical protein
MLAGHNKENDVLTFSPTKRGPAPKSNNLVQEVIPSMICAKYQNSGIIDFGNVSLNTFTSMQFRMINPNQHNSVKISIAKCPIDKGFTIMLDNKGSQEIIIEGNSKATGIISWTPKVNMAISEKIVLHLDTSGQMVIKLNGKAGTGENEEKVRIKPDRKALAAIAPRDKLKPKTTKITKVSIEPMNYEESWAAKQMQSFTDWLNFKFSQGYTSSVEIESVSSSTDSSEVGYTLDMKALMQSRLNAQIKLRATLAYNHQDMKIPQFNVREEIDKGNIIMLKDKDVHADLGLRKTFMEILFSYELPYLKLGLEVVFDEKITIQAKDGTQDNNCTFGSIKWEKEIRNFVNLHLLADSVIQSRFTKEQLLHPCHQAELKRQLREHFVHKFLCLVQILDHSRHHRLLAIPTLFTKESKIKSSKGVLLNFCMEFLGSQSDFVKTLSVHEYHVHFEQESRHEYDYTVNDITTDLRDGTRLLRLAELLTEYSDISCFHRNTISRMQKLNNVSMALRALLGQDISADEIKKEANSIVGGNRECTLLLLWKLQYKYELRTMTDSNSVHLEATNVREEEHWRGTIFNESDTYNLAVDVPIRSADGTITYPAAVNEELDNEDFAEEDSSAYALADWCNSIAGLYGVPVHNITDSLADGRALCLIVHYYHPNVLPIASIKRTYAHLDGAMANVDIAHAYDMERKNFALLKNSCKIIGGIPLMLPEIHTNNAPDVKTMTVFLGYLFSRLTESAADLRAAIRIQRSFRKFLVRFPPTKESVATQKAVKSKTLRVKEWINKFGITDVGCTVVMSVHNAADMIKGVVRTYHTRRMYLLTLKARKKEMEQRRIDAELHAIEMTERLAHLEKETMEALELESIRAEKEEAMAKRQAIEIEEYHENLRLAEIQMQEDAVQKRIDDAVETARQSVFIEAAEELERNKLALEETARAVIQEAEHDLANKDAELKKEAYMREELEKKLAEYEDARLDAEEHARRTEEMKAELEERLAEEENLAEELQEKLEEEIRRREEKDEQTKIDLQQQATILNRQNEEDIVQRMKSQRISGDEMTQNLVKIEQEKRIEAEKLAEQERSAKQQLELQLVEAANTQQILKDQLQAIEDQKVQHEIEEQKRKEEKKHFDHLCTMSAMKIQSFWRSWRVIKASIKAQLRGKAGTIIANWMTKMKTKIISRANKRSSLRASACLASAKAAQEKRAIRFNSAAKTITVFFKSYRSLRRSQILIYGFRRFAALYRAATIRSTNGPHLVEIRNKLKLIQSRNHASIGSRTDAAIYVLTSTKNVTELLEACQVLLSTTAVSVECCVKFVQTSATQLLLNTIRSCNRSTTHQEMLVCALNSLLNVCRRTELASKVASTVESTDILMDIMQMFRDKKQIFCLSCKLLCRLTACNIQTMKICNTSECRKRLEGIYHIIERKHRLEERVARVGATSSVMTNLLSASVESPMDHIRHLFFILDEAK